MSIPGFYPPTGMYPQENPRVNSDHGHGPRKMSSGAVTSSDQFQRNIDFAASHIRQAIAAGANSELHPEWLSMLVQSLSQLGLVRRYERDSELVEKNFH